MVGTERLNARCWTHPSVVSFAAGRNPVSVMVEKARGAVFDGIQRGWSGPPYDPFQLAELLGIGAVPREDVLDARIVSSRNRKLVIEFNPDRARARIRYSIAHELAHTFFADCRENIRERRSGKMGGESWQVEALCNIGAAELLMPIGSFPKLSSEELTIDALMDLQKEYDVSTEALLIRMVRLREEPCFVFCCSRRGKRARSERYVVDYAVPSGANPYRLASGTRLPADSVVGECTAIGFTAKGDEEWGEKLGRVHVECVGLPPYPGQRLPRVAGFGKVATSEKVSLQRIRYVRGDATKPHGNDTKIIAFIVNDKARSWGAGFAKVVQRKWPFVLEEFQRWRESKREEFSLGAINISAVEGGIFACEMVCQHGYGPSRTPRIRYSALETCLKKLAQEAIGRKASVHMPRIGSGQAGGSWWIVSEMIDYVMIRRNIKVTVYDLPRKAGRGMTRQLSFLD